MKTKTLILAAAVFPSLLVSGQDIMKPIIPQNTLKLVVKQAVAEAKAYTDKAVASGTAGGVTTNDLKEVASVADQAKESTISNAADIAALSLTVADKLDKTTADGLYQAKGEYLTTETDPNVPTWAKAPAKPVYDASEVTFGNGFVGGYLEELNSNKANKTDIPAVPLWAMASTKPTYNADEITYGNGFVGGFLTELNTGKANKSDVYTKTQADQTFLTHHQDLSDYAPKSSVYTKGEVDTAFGHVEENLALKAGKSTVYTKDETDAKLLKLSNKLSLLEATVALLGGTGDAVEVNETVNYNDPTKSVAFAGEFNSTNGASITAKKVAMSGISGSIDAVPVTGATVALLVDAESLNIANSSLEGTTQQSSNLIEVRGAETMVIKDTTFTGDTYNTLMTGQRTSGYLKELTIENCVFNENCKHINIWFAGFQDNAVLNIKNCTFKTCEQFLCISDHHGAVANNLTVNIEKVTIENYEVGDAYEGIMFVDDRVCTSEAQLRSVNPFSKVTINLKNVTAGGVKLTAANFGIGTGTTGQQLYYYSKSGGGVYPYNETNASLFPTVNFVE